MIKDRLIVSRNRDVMDGTAFSMGARVPVRTLLDYPEARESIDDFLEEAKDRVI